MIHRDDLPATPDWDVKRALSHYFSAEPFEDSALTAPPNIVLGEN